VGFLTFTHFCGLGARVTSLLLSCVCAAGERVSLLLCGCALEEEVPLWVTCNYFSPVGCCSGVFLDKKLGNHDVARLAGSAAT
jgi:hypothetical protein